tara:strand:- start:69 stop:680 length:612 start_codon:yes stop_codon:yes gene_type:complete
MNKDFPNKKYNIIYADPPWSFGSKSYQDGGRNMIDIQKNHYDTMTEQDICDLPVQDISDDNCILFMWVTDSHLQEALNVMRSWNFTYKTIGFTWVKQYASGSYCYNFSPYLLKSTEICLIGMKGKLNGVKKRNDVKGLVFAERTKHSKKPNEVRKRIEQMCGDLPRIELFARETAEGWDSWGNQVEDIQQYQVKDIQQYKLFQ